VDRASSLVGEILANPERDDLDEVANELLSEYYDGSDLSSLRELLRSQDENAASWGVWISAELAGLGRPLLSEVTRLLVHPSKRVRFFAIECVQEWAGPSNSKELATAVSLLEDSDQAVRWKASVFVAFAPRAQLEYAVAGFAAMNPKSPYLGELRWMLGPDATEPAKISIALQDSCLRHRKIAVAAAVRIARTDIEPLRLATMTDDSEIAQFARDMLERVAPADNAPET
jgi:hypothetical protein